MLVYILSLYIITRLAYSGAYGEVSFKYIMSDYIYNEFLVDTFMPLVNTFMPYFLIIITTIFNIPVLYIISSKIIKNKFIVIFIKIVLVSIFAWNLFLPSLNVPLYLY